VNLETDAWIQRPEKAEKHCHSRLCARDQSGEEEREERRRLSWLLFLYISFLSISIQVVSASCAPLLRQATAGAKGQQGGKEEGYPGR